VQEFYGPESWGDYSNYMRSGVDIGDEYRKMFETSTRAIQKMPRKTLAWHEDVLVDNYYHIYRFWHHDSTYGSNSTNRARVQKYRYLKEALHGIGWVLYAQEQSASSCRKDAAVFDDAITCCC
jgi:hypothetical protein